MSGWGFDLSAISDAVGEALLKAKVDLEKGVDSALGIDPNAKPEQPAVSGTSALVAGSSNDANGGCTWCPCACNSSPHQPTWYHTCRNRKD